MKYGLKCGRVHSFASGNVRMPLTCRQLVLSNQITSGRINGWMTRSMTRSTTRSMGSTRMNTGAGAGPGFIPPPQPQIQIKKRRSVWPYILLGCIAISAAVFKYITWHNYPPTVAAKLRKGLRAEIDGGGPKTPDYRIALQYYLEALKEADDVGLYNLSDEYTGLQIKIAEMYEQLDMEEEAHLVYRELGACFIQALADGTQLSDSLRPHLIQRDLRVALKYAMYEASKNPDIAKMGLLVHFLIAQKEVAKRDPELAKLIEKEKTRTSIDMTIPLNPANSKHPASKNPEAWMPFRDELFNARDMFVALCLATGDIGLALQTKLATTEWMALSGSDLSEVLMSFCNVGSIFYLQAEELELAANKAGLNASSNKKTLDGRPTEKAKEGAKDEQDKDKLSVSAEGSRAAASREAFDIGLAHAFGGGMDRKEAAEALAKMAQDSITNARTCFNVILDAVQKLPGSSRREDGMAEVQALSTYGLGVISLHNSDFDKASELLREARLRAKGCGFDDLVSSTETELQKLEKAMNSKDGPGEGYEVPSLNVILSKGQAPSKANAIVNR